MALQRLRTLGAELLGQRVRTNEGELDLVLRLDGRLLCVEVKSSRWIGAGATFRPGNRFSLRQEQRQVQAAQALARRWTPGYEPRRLLAELWFDDDGGLVQERWHELESRPRRPRAARQFRP